MTALLALARWLSCVGGRCHDPAVNIGTFWEIIETARASAAPGRPVHRCLARHLAALTEQEILEYQERFDEVHGALYRWDVWAAAYLIGGGCSDDSFIDFRAGLIAQCRDWYDQAAVCPDSLAGHPAVTATTGPAWDRPLFDEQVNYAASYVFELVTGDEGAFYDAWASRQRPDRSLVDMGEEFDFDDGVEMRRRMPRLSALFLGPIART